MVADMFDGEEVKYILEGTRRLKKHGILGKRSNRRGGMSSVTSRSVFLLNDCLLFSRKPTRVRQMSTSGLSLPVSSPLGSKSKAILTGLLATHGGHKRGLKRIVALSKVERIDVGEDEVSFAMEYRTAFDEDGSGRGGDIVTLLWVCASAAERDDWLRVPLDFAI